MALVSQDTPRLGNALKHEYQPATSFCRDVAVINEDAKFTLKVATVLGKVTADGKFKVQDASANDGSEIAAAVTIEGSDIVIEAATDTRVIAIARGPAIFAKEALVLGAGTNTDAEKKAVYASLQALGILVSDQV